ncbi:MAG: transcriptional regulator [Limisphaerales bacterium]
MSRRRIIPLILDQPKSLSELARQLAMHPRDVENDLKHLLLSVKHTEYEADIVPAECRKCGFEFSTDKLHKPSKCPKCKATWISEPLIGLKLKGQPSA